MSASLGFEQLIDYSDWERRRWHDWVAANPVRLQIPFQGDGRFATLHALLEHVFLVERRHLARLQGATPPDASGVPAGDWETLFDYATLVRADLRRFVQDLDEATAASTITIPMAAGGAVSMTERKLTAHILVHEIRHLAQMAYAARLAGHEPPGQHDLAFCPDLA